MSFARHGSGPRAELGALASQVHPVFMLPPLSVSVFGGILAARATGAFDAAGAAAHVTAIFFAVYTAHVKDGYVDFYRRDEDDDHPLTAAGCRLLLAGASVGFLLALAGVWLFAGTGAALLTVPTWLIAYNHAPQLDTNPVGATVGYPLGIALSLIGGYHVQAGGVDALAIAAGAVFLVLLSGVKVIDDAQDYEYDGSIGKPTVAVVVGPTKARRIAYGLMGVALLGVAGFAVGGVLPPSAVLAPVAFAAVAGIAYRAGPELATMLLVRGSYVFLAVLVGAVWFRPLA